MSISTEPELEPGLAIEENRAQPSLKSSKNGNARTPDHNFAQLNRQYTPSDTLQLDNDLESSRKSYFRTLVGGFGFSNEPGLPRSHATIDLLVTIFCFATVHLIYLGSLNLSSQRTIALLSSLVFIILFLSAGGMYNTKSLRSLNRELKYLLLCWMCAFAAVGLFAFLTQTAQAVSRVWLTTSMVLALASLAGARVLGSLGFLAKNKVRAKNIIVCGNAQSIKSVMHSLYKLSNSRVRVARVFEFVTPHPGEGLSSDSLQVSAEQIIKFVEKQRQSDAAIEQVWIAVSTNQSKIVEQLSETLINSPVDVCVVPDHYTELLLKGHVIRFGETKIVNVSEITLSPAADQFKRVFDVFIASAALLALCMPMAVIASLIKIESPGPALFRQKRYGVDGREIEVLKFRSMKVHSDSEVRQATRNDARVTRVGKVLRSTSLDELPQLLNVIGGTMSLVGPRPHAAAHNEIWRNQIKGYMLRHKVRPGITGWAQVNGWRGETDTALKMQQRVKYDLEYIQNWSPWMDVKIVFSTIFVLFRDKNAY